MKYVRIWINVNVSKIWLKMAFVRVDLTDILSCWKLVKIYFILLIIIFQQFFLFI